MWYAALDRKMAQAEKDPENSGLKKIISFFFKLYPNVPPLVQTISKCPTTCLPGISPGLLAKFHAAAGSSKKHRSQNQTLVATHAYMLFCLSGSICLRNSSVMKPCRELTYIQHIIIIHVFFYWISSLHCSFKLLGDQWRWRRDSLSLGLMFTSSTCCVLMRFGLVKNTKMNEAINAVQRSSLRRETAL